MSDPRRPRGYILLLVLFAVLLLAIIAVASLSLGERERQTELVSRDQVMAQSMAEVGLDRTWVYLATLLDTEVDLDRALDPQLDTTCAVTPPTLVLDGGQSDDHLPRFLDGKPVVAGAAGLTWLMVSWADAGTDAGSDGGITAGGYLVRIDDNADDFDADLPVSMTGNHVCAEQTVPLDGGQNPVRDRDRTVEVTVVGFYPGSDVSGARSFRSVRATFGPGSTGGIVTNGSVDMQGSSHICDRYGGVVAGGNITGACLCGIACPGHTACPQNDVCNARAGGPTCTASPSGGGGSCLAGQTVAPAPRINPWDRLNAPALCAGGACEPFWYLRETSGAAELFQWNYAGVALDAAACTDPQRFGRICHPSDNAATCAGASCWTQQQVAGVDGGSDDELHMADSPGWTAVPPAPVPYNYGLPLVWRLSAAGAASSAGCGGSPTPPYPWPASGGRGLGWNDDIGNTFEMLADGALGKVVPRGTWFIEGNVRWKADAPPCAALPLGWKLTVLAAGDVEFEEDAAFHPSNRRGLAVVAGRDLKITTGNTDIYTCGDSAAFGAHEQFEIGANQTLWGQLVVDNMGTCSSLVSGTAVQLSGGGVVRVPEYPPLSLGRGVTRLRWSPTPY